MSKTVAIVITGVAVRSKLGLDQLAFYIEQHQRTPGLRRCWKPRGWFRLMKRVLAYTVYLRCPIPISAGTKSELPAPGSRRYIHSSSEDAKESNQIEVDEFGIPIKPTWSVRSLLASYPSPSINDETFNKLHRLAALRAPEKDSKEREVLREEMEGLVRLVGAVRIAKVNGENTGEEQGLVDGRIYPLPQTIELGYKAKDEHLDGAEAELPNGRELLRHSRTANQTAYVLPDLSKR
jgi:hypothetical protein